MVVGKSNLNSSQNESEDFNKLQYVPQFYPILKSTIDLKEDHKLFQINPECVIIYNTFMFIIIF